MGDVVELWVYDLSGGLARALSPMLLGKQIDGVWHTSIVVGGLEHYFGHGINAAAPGTTPFGHPVQKIRLGTTYLDVETRRALLEDLAPRFSAESYSLLEHNCNTFSNEFSQLLVGEPIPAHITGLPKEVLDTPFGQMLRPTLSQFERHMRSMRQGVQTFGASQTGVAGAPAPAGPSAAVTAGPAAAAASAGPATTTSSAVPPRPSSPWPAAEATEEALDTAIVDAMVNEEKTHESGAAAGPRPAGAAPTGVCADVAVGPAAGGKALVPTAADSSAAEDVVSSMAAAIGRSMAAGDAPEARRLEAEAAVMARLHQLLASGHEEGEAKVTALHEEAARQDRLRAAERRASRAAQLDEA